MPIKVEYTCDICGAESSYHSEAPFDVNSDGSLEWSRIAWEHAILCNEHLAKLPGHARKHGLPSSVQTQSRERPHRHPPSRRQRLDDWAA